MDEEQREEYVSSSVRETRRKWRNDLYWSLVVEMYWKMGSCQNYTTCSVPICPLDLDKDKRSKLEGEKECWRENGLRMS